MGVEVELLEEYEQERDGVDTRCYGIKEGEFNPLRATEKQVGGSHYKDMAIQPTTFIEQNKLSWCEGNAVKYICRHRVKGTEKDILKAIHYLELLLEKEYEYVRPENITA